ncbi:MAG: hypothetical protein V3V20_05755 [Algisphaera sp.]
MNLRHIALLMALTWGSTGCMSVDERRAQFLDRRATVEVTTARGQPVILNLVASNDGPARAGISYIRTEQWKLALDQLRIATDQKTHDHGAWFALGAVYEKTGHMNQAYDAYRNAFFLRNDADYEEAWRRIRVKHGSNASDNDASHDD